MNAYSSIEKPIAKDAWKEASAAAALWRGSALQQFAHAEGAVTDTLALMGLVKGLGAEIKLPHLVGQRFVALAKAVGSDGPFLQEGGKVSAALANFMEFDTLRPALTHGVIKVALCNNADWIALFSVKKFKNGKVVRDVYVLEGDIADERLQALRQATNRLRHVLRMFNNGIRNEQDEAVLTPSAPAGQASH